MNATKKARKAKLAEKRERKERRFSPEPTSSRAIVLGGMAGALALGAGVYAQWVREEPTAFAPYLVAIGALVLGFALWKTGEEIGRVRVGDAGVALEKDNDLLRILWCDIEKLSLDNGKLLIRGKEARLELPVAIHPKAAAWVVAEAGKRVPDVVNVDRASIEKLGETKELDGEFVLIEEVQITGRHCRASGKPISFERDARLCPVCGETYLKDQVPKKCLTCNGELGTRAREA